MVKRWPIFLIWLALWLVAPIALVRMLWAILIGNTKRAWGIALGFDLLGNVALNGDLGQTVSSRSAHSINKSWGRWLCAALDTVDPGHCERARTDPKQNPPGSD